MPGKPFGRIFSAKFGAKFGRELAGNIDRTVGRKVVVVCLAIWTLAYAGAASQAGATPVAPKQDNNRSEKSTGVPANSQPGTPSAGTRPTAPPSSQSSAPSNIPPPYLLAGDDVIEISVVNFPMFNIRQTIPPDGHLSVSLLEPVLVLGKTTTEVAQILTEKWKKYVVNPSVSVALITRRRENVLLHGHIKAGTLEYRQGMRLTEALAEQGGETPGADMAHLLLTRHTGERLILDLSHPESRSGGAADLPLLPGDVIYIPERHTQVTILGEVNKPGTQDYQEDMTVLQAITAFGGIKQETANLAGTTLLRDGKELPVDLEALLRRGDMTANLKLQAGDRLMVPEIRTHIYVFGNVRQPGNYTFKDRDRVLSAIIACGGPSQNADLSRVNVIHINKEKNLAERETVNIEKIGTKGDMKGNILLQPGDAIFVPDKKRSFQLGDLFGVLTGLNLIDGLGRILTKGPGN